MAASVSSLVAALAVHALPTSRSHARYRYHYSLPTSRLESMSTDARASDELAEMCLGVLDGFLAMRPNTNEHELNTGS